jgi:hypothetical protein
MSQSWEQELYEYVRSRFGQHAAERTLQAAWEGDIDVLDEYAHCKCCCHKHTFSDCPARLWNDCRGQFSLDEESWVRFYVEAHGMTRSEFFAEDY